MAKLVHNAQKKQHRERSQIQSRSKFGFLEKHKDYTKRAKDYHAKQNTLKILRSKVSDRNPDEYYHKMNSQKMDARSGLLIKDREESESLSMDQIKLLKSQDSNYLKILQQQNLKQILKRKESLLFNGENERKHKVFVDNDTDLKQFDLAKRFNTTKDLLDRVENRLTLDQLTDGTNKIGEVDDLMAKESLDKKKLKKYKLLKNYIDREKQLNEVLQTLEQQKEGMKNGAKKKIKNDEGKVIFKWKKQRKR
ncbi:hypothetical protein QEN19_002575 [Hanseniaspora menglaensis]